MDKDWLDTKITVQEAEEAHAVTDKRLGEDPVPFGFMNDRWKELLAKMKPGDELWTFCSPKETWSQLAGRAGIAVMRDGEMVAGIYTLMN